MKESFSMHRRKRPTKLLQALAIPTLALALLLAPSQALADDSKEESQVAESTVLATVDPVQGNEEGLAELGEDTKEEQALQAGPEGTGDSTENGKSDDKSELSDENKPSDDSDKLGKETTDEGQNSEDEGSESQSNTGLQENEGGEVDSEDQAPEVDMPTDADEVVEGTTKISVISDIHILPEDMIADTEDFKRHKNSDRKYFEESVGILDGALKMITENDSEVIFVTGDLTKDGELEAHKKVAEMLEKWVADGEKAGKKRRVFLVPGNHDMNNHNGKNFATADGKAVNATLTNPDDYIENYEKLVFGHGDVVKYNDSDWYKNYLEKVNSDYKTKHGADRAEEYYKYAQGYTSYVGRLADKGITVVGLDTAIYTGDVRKDGKDGSQSTEGIVTEAQMSWLADRAAEANKRGDTVMVLCHHAFMPTFKDQEKILSPYIIRNWDTPFASDDKRLQDKTPREVLEALGIRYLFTGHLHANDIAKDGAQGEGKTLHQIQTGSTVTYPMPIRHLTVERTLVDAENPTVEGAQEILTKMDIQTDHIRKFTYLDHTAGEDGKGAYITIDLDKENPTEEEKIRNAKYSKDGLITEEMAETMADTYVGKVVKDAIGNVDLNKIASEKINDELVKSGILAEDEINANDLGETLMSAVEAIVRSKTNMDESTDEFELSFMGGVVKVKGEFVYEEGSEELIIEATPAAFASDGPYKIKAEHLGKIMSAIVGDLQTKGLSDAEIDKALNTIVDALLNAPMEEVTDDEGQVSETITLRRLANEVYGGYLAGDETQPDWLKKIIERYSTAKDGKNPDLIGDILTNPSVLDSVDAAVDEILSQVTYYDPSQGPTGDANKDRVAFIHYLMGVEDKSSLSVVSSIPAGFFGESLRDLFHNETVNGAIKKALSGQEADDAPDADAEGKIEVSVLAASEEFKVSDLLVKALQNEQVKNLIAKALSGYVNTYDEISPFAVSVMKNMSNEDYAFAYAEDNNTQLSSTSPTGIIKKPSNTKPATPVVTPDEPKESTEPSKPAEPVEPETPDEKPNQGKDIEVLPAPVYWHEGRLEVAEGPVLVQTTSVAKAGKTAKNPSTGDDFGLALYVLLACGLAMVSLKKKDETEIH